MVYFWGSTFSNSHFLQLQNLSSMFAAAAAAASGGHRGPRFLFNNPKRPGGLESPPHSLDNRSTPGSLDLSRSKDEYYDEADDAPPTMVKMEAMVYPKIDSEDEEEHRRLEKRIFPTEDSNEDAEDLSASKKMKIDTEESQLDLENEPQNNNSSDESANKLVNNATSPTMEDALRVRDDLKQEESTQNT